MGNQPSSSDDNNDSGATSEGDVESNDGPSEAAQVALTLGLLPREAEALSTTSEADASNSDQVGRQAQSLNDNDHQAAPPTMENTPVLPLNTEEDSLSFQEIIHQERGKRDSLYEAILSKESSDTTKNSNANLHTSGEPCPVDRIKLLLDRQDAIIRDLVQQEEFLCRHYSMFRDTDKEQNALISSWMTCFGTLQGFLWVALALSLNHSTRGGIWYTFSIVTCCIGMVVSFLTLSKVREARATKQENMESWNVLLEDVTTTCTCRFDISSLGIEEGYSVNNVIGWLEAIPVVFIVAWGAVLVVIASSGMASVVHSYGPSSDNVTTSYILVGNNMTDAIF